MSLCADRGEAVAAKSRIRSGKRGVNGGNLQVGPVVVDQLRRGRRCRGSRRSRSTSLGVGVAARSTRNVAQLVGHAASSSSRITRPRRRRLSARLEVADEVLGLLLDLDVAVAEEPEERRRPCIVAREQASEKTQRSAPRARTNRGMVAGQADEARRACRAAAAARAAARRLPRSQLQHHAEAAVGDERERMRRVDRQRRQDREHLLDEALAQELEIAPAVSSPGSRTAMPCSRSSAVELVPAALLTLRSARRRAA